MARLLVLALAAAVLALASAAPSFTIVATQPAVFGRRANISVAWSVDPSAGETASDDDTQAVAGLYISAFSPPGFVLPAKYKSFNASSSSPSKGVLTFEMLNIRQPIEFVLTSGGLPIGPECPLPGPPKKEQKPAAGGCPRPVGVKVEAKSGLVKPDSLPMQLHTSATAAPGQLQIMWVDDVATAAPIVQYGKTAAALDKSSTGTSSTYSLAEIRECVTADTTAVTRFIDPGHIHTVLLTDLPPGPFFYRVGHHGALSFSAVQEHAGPLPDPARDSSTVKLLYVADMGAGPARPDEIGGAYDSEGLAINRENSGPKSGGEQQIPPPLPTHTHM